MICTVLQDFNASGTMERNKGAELEYTWCFPQAGVGLMIMELGIKSSGHVACNALKRAGEMQAGSRSAGYQVETRKTGVLRCALARA